MSQTEPRIARSVLFVDFDNMGLSIKKTDEALANAFARAPQVWVDALERGELIDDDGLLAPRRRFLMKRCYANPRLIDPYRANFTWAGFQVVDCPPLTGGGKNSADIYMVMDILDALEHKTPFDEFFILSSDADFTPVLTRLTAYDRRTVIFANQVTAQAYKTMCDGLIPEPALMDLLAKTVEYARRERSRQTPPAPAYQGASQPSEPRGGEARSPDIRNGEIRNGEARGGEARNGEADQPAEALGPAEAAMAVPSTRPRVPQIPDRVRPMARAIAEETDVPYLAPIVYAEMFKAIASEVNEKGFSLNKTVKGVHERIEAAAGWGIYPKYIAFVLKGIQFTGLDLASGDVTPEELAKAFQRQVIRLAGRAGMELQEPDRKNVAWWMRSALPRAARPDDASPAMDRGEDGSVEPAGTVEPIDDAEGLVDARDRADLDPAETTAEADGDLITGTDTADLLVEDERDDEDEAGDEAETDLGPDELDARDDAALDGPSADPRAVPSDHEGVDASGLGDIDDVTSGHADTAGAGREPVEALDEESHGADLAARDGRDEESRPARKGYWQKSFYRPPTLSDPGEPEPTQGADPDEAQAPRLNPGAIEPVEVGEPAPHPFSQGEDGFNAILDQIRSSAGLSDEKSVTAPATDKPEAGD